MLNAILNKEQSLLKPVDGLSAEISACILSTESRWHYSQHFFAESKGEEVIEDLLRISSGPKQKALLGAQLKDEKVHTELFKQLTNQIGLDSRATGYADGYSQLVLSQNSLSEKVFVFQIMTEAASAAYCEWRMLAFSDSESTNVDNRVRNDEIRHLDMGHTMLKICDRDEIKKSLTRERRAALIREMNEICLNVAKRGLLQAAAEDSGSEAIMKSTLLDRMVSRSILTHARKVEDLLLTEDRK
jgi:hypothetical protein